MKYIGEKDEAVSLLKEENVGRLAMLAENHPYIVPLCYAYYEGSIYFHCGMKGLKLEYIRKNNLVCFQVDRVSSMRVSELPCNFGFNYRSVIVFGRAIEVEDHEEKFAVLNYITAVFAKNKPVSPLERKEIESVQVIKIIIDEMTIKINEK